MQRTLLIADADQGEGQLLASLRVVRLDVQRPSKSLDRPAGVPFRTVGALDDQRAQVVVGLVGVFRVQVHDFLVGLFRLFQSPCIGQQVGQDQPGLGIVRLDLRDPPVGRFRGICVPQLSGDVAQPVEDPRIFRHALQGGLQNDARLLQIAAAFVQAVEHHLRIGARRVELDGLSRLGLRLV